MSKSESDHHHLQEANIVPGPEYDVFGLIDEHGNLRPPPQMELELSPPTTTKEIALPQPTIKPNMTLDLFERQVNSIMNVLASSGSVVHQISTCMAGVQGQLKTVHTKVVDIDERVIGLAQQVQQLEQLQQSSNSQGQQIIQQTDFMTNHLHEKVWLRRVVFFLFKHAFATAHGQVCAFPISFVEVSADQPDTFVAVHIPLMTWMFRQLYRDTTTKEVTITFFRGLLNHFFENGTRVPPAVYNTLNRIVPIQIKAKVKENEAAMQRLLNQKGPWQIFPLRKFVQALQRLHTLVQAKHVQLPLATDCDAFQPFNRASVASADSITQGPDMRMAFQIPCWQETLAPCAWREFVTAMQPVVEVWLAEEAQDVTQAFVTAANAPFVLLDQFCRPRVNLPVRTYQAARVQYQADVQARVASSSSSSSTAPARKRKAKASTETEPAPKRRRQQGKKKVPEPEHEEEDEAVASSPAESEDDEEAKKVKPVVTRRLHQRNTSIAIVPPKRKRGRPANKRPPTSDSSESESSEEDEDAVNRMLAADDDEEQVTCELTATADLSA